MIEYISFEELKNNVTWPTWTQEAQKTTINCCSYLQLYFALAIWGVDKVFCKRVR